MRKLQVVLCSALFSAAALTNVSTAFAEGDAGAADLSVAEASSPDTQNGAIPQANAADPYAVKSFFADFTHFAIGDNVPELYRTKKYEVTQWKVRNLPEPRADSHWTYMGGNYVMINNADGKILQAESGEIFTSINRLAVTE